MKKRLLSFVLAALMIASLLPATALAANIVDSGTCGAEVTWTLDSEGVLTISGSGYMYDNGSSASGAPWYGSRSRVKSAVIADGVTSIGVYAFYDCTSLTSVTIPDSVTSIGSGAFSYCKSLTSVTIPDSVTSIGGAAFNGCSSLTSVTIPDSVTSIGGEAFFNCTSLTSVTIPNSVTSIGEYAFSDCSSLTSVTIPDSVTSIVNGAFAGCRSLTSVTIPDSVTSIDWSAFAGCRSLTSVTIPDSVTSIGDGAFSYCESLTSVTIPDSVTSIGDGAFAPCTSLTGIWVAEGSSHYASDAFGVLFNKDKTTLVQCPGAFAAYAIPDSVTSIGVQAFWGCTSLTSVTIPNGVTSIGALAFSNCKSLTSVTIPDSVTSIGERAFLGCTSLTSVTIPDSVTSIGGSAFKDCTSLTSVTIPDSVTSIGVGAFASCTSLTGIWVAEGSSHYASDAFGVLFNKDKTTLVQCPGAISGSYAIPDSVTIIGEYAFDGCTSLTSVTIPNSVTSIGEYAFAYCTSLTSVTIPDSVTSIGGWAFYNCTSLTSVTIPNSVTSIYWGAFGDCTSLTDVYFTGTESAWNSIAIGGANDALKNANIHYNYVSHTHSYKDVVTAPTCTEKGYTTHTCSCGDSYVDTYVDALGHAWDNGKVTKEPTETETGVKAFTCTRCGETKTESIPVVSVDVTEMFTDVTKNWAYPGIQYCVTHKLMGSTGGDKFAPTMTTTRAQIVQILYNLEGEPEVSGTTPFTDLTQDWYQDAVLWAYQTGVVAGTGDGTTFDPDLPVTREQIAVILMEYTDRILNIKRTWTPADLSTFPDAASVSDWAKDAMADAVALGLISGASNGGQTYLNPQGSATREQVATILMEFCKNVKK